VSQYQGPPLWPLSRWLSDGTVGSPVPVLLRGAGQALERLSLCPFQFSSDSGRSQSGHYTLEIHVPP
jgi:hypothetical protein